MSTEEKVNIEETQDFVQNIKSEIAKLIIGQEEMVELLITAILAKGHVLIEGIPGLAKTLTARLISKTIDSGFKRIQFTPDLMPADILGTSIFNAGKASFEFKQGPIFSNIILIDEINRAPAKTQSALFEVMEERQVTIDGHTYPMSMPFMIIGTQNPVDMEGTYRLPAAQMDRFLFKIVLNYPTLDQEVQIISSYHRMNNSNDMNLVNHVISASDLIALQETVGRVHVEDNLMTFIAAIVHKTRAYRDIDRGASPRASLAILAASKAMAVIRNRNFVTPDDIITVAIPVLNHRIELTPEKEMEGTDASRVLKQLLTEIEVPR